MKLRITALMGVIWLAASTARAQAPDDRSLTLTVGPVVSGVQFAMFGFADASVGGVATASVFVRPELAIDLQLRGGQVLDSDPNVAWYAGLGARARWFFGRFYVAAGAHVRNYAVSDLGDEPIDGHVGVLGLDAGFGNQWQWDRLTIGVEWFGLCSTNIPLYEATDRPLADASFVRSGWGEMRFVAPYVGATW